MYRPYPNRDRALRQLARKARVTLGIVTMPDGSEMRVFPGQSFAAWAAYLQSDEHHEKTRRIVENMAAIAKSLRSAGHRS